MSTYYQKKLRPRRVTTVLIFLVVIVLLAVISFEISISNSKKIEADSNEESVVTNPIEEKKSVAKPTKSEIVCLDPGHGGKDAGAVYKNITEADLDLTVALKVRKLLENDGYKVYMTRSEDIFLYKRPRARYCNSVNASVLVAIHHNSYTVDTNVDYSTALYYKDSDQALAANILDAVAEKLGTKNQGIAKFDNSELYIATMPAMLSEAFFITNSKEYNLVNQKNSPRLTAEADGIATGIKNYFSDPNKTGNIVGADSLYVDRADYGD